MKAALYVRVSTTEQAEEGFSIAAQINELTKYCAKEGIEVYKVYPDEGISGTKEERPFFQQMLKDADNKLFDMILVHKYDRFARNVELSQKVKKQLKKTGIALISITEPLEDSPMGFFVGGLHELMAEYYSKNLGRESKKGHIERARQGLHNGSIPYGYKRSLEHPSGIVINEEQAKIVRLIYDLYINQGKGSTWISNYLNQSRIPCAVRGEWGHFTVNKILKNIKYIGKIMYDGQIYDGKHDPIIEEKTFELAQRFMKDRTWKREYRGANYEKFVFLGFLRCGYCKKIMRIQNNYSHNRTSSRYYYVCNSATHYDNSLRCEHLKCYSWVKLEERIWKELLEISKGKMLNFEQVSSNRVYDVISDQKEKLNKELLRAKKAYLAGVFSLKEYTEIRNKLEQEINEIKSVPINKTDRNKELRKRIKTVHDLVQEEESIPKKKAILKTLISSVYVFKDKLGFELV